MEQVDEESHIIPSISMIDIEHHDRYVGIFIVEFSALVHELRLHLDDAVKGLVGDECLVSDVKLQQGCRVCSVNHCMVLPSPRAGVGKIKKLTAVEF